jgi:hypothetical protein
MLSPITAPEARIPAHDASSFSASSLTVRKYWALVRARGDD